ncbi:hypothetical protein [Burkholderia oklahomensis]|uniref:hypothetical protein n=1 Tax=Burkholderia oklahomensis TaxID=342113 RepID=UPI000A983AFC|nr:hypothetical protein [Burkholderia oklahomensis]
MKNDETFERNKVYFILSNSIFHLTKIDTESGFRAAFCQYDRDKTDDGADFFIALFALRGEINLTIEINRVITRIPDVSILKDLWKRRYWDGAPQKAR